MLTTKRTPLETERVKKTFLIFLTCIACLQVFSQKKNKLINGLYLQWGYNTEWYTRSNIHFNTMVDGVLHKFTIIKARAKDRDGLSSLYKKTLQISIPQYNYRVGFYLNPNHSRAIEINYDHAKYIVTDYRTVHIRGMIGQRYYDQDTIFFFNQVHFEHTNGANFYQVNYVHQLPLKKHQGKTFISAVWKAGAGILIPKTDVTLSGKRVDNRFKVSGYCLGIEGGARLFLSKRFFLEATGKAGFANYTNALGLGNGRVNHSFGYLEMIGTIGYEIHF